jgi:uncharacterized iron-regulated membrane protein
MASAGAPTDQSGLASSLGVLSIAGGVLSLMLSACCCPFIVIGALISLGMGVTGWVVASKQLRAVQHAPHLRHLEPPARTAQLLCVIGIILSALAALVSGSWTVLTLLAVM